MFPLNCRHTKIRRDLLKVLTKSKKPRTASDILSCLKKDYPTINKSTVYRQLDFLSEKQFLTALEINGRKHFLLEQKHPHVVLVCTLCKKVFPADGNFLSAKVKQIVSENNFQIKNYSLVLIGKCQYCQK